MMLIPDKLNEIDLYSYKIYKYEFHKILILIN